ncbi:MAG: sulfatase-like hydrolase/transferase [Bacteroidales bacterium]|nr:sulfatase-like hydrolase/transferase [Bacteroidales bacterium]
MADHNIEPGKATSFEKGIHVPLIVYWPQQTSGNISDALVQNTDIYPTILEAARIPLPENYLLDGKSMIPIIERSETIHTGNIYLRKMGIPGRFTMENINT